MKKRFNKFDQITNIKDNNHKTIFWGFPLTLSHLKNLKHYTIVNIQTTGLDPTTDSIIEMCIIKYKNNKEIDKFHTLIAADKRLDSEIIEITGLTNQILKNATSAQTAMKHFKKITTWSSAPIICFHANFVIPFLTINYPKTFFDNGPFISNAGSLFHLSKQLIHFADVPDYSFETLCNHFGIPVNNFRRSTPDAVATNLLLQEFIKISKSK